MRQTKQLPQAPLFGVVEGPPFKNGVSSFRQFGGILKWALGLNNCGSDN